MDFETILSETEKALLLLDNNAKNALNQSQEIEERKELYNLTEDFRNAKLKYQLLFEEIRDVLYQKNAIEKTKQVIMAEIDKQLTCYSSLDPYINSELNQVQTAIRSLLN